MIAVRERLLVPGDGPLDHGGQGEVLTDVAESPNSPVTVVAQQSPGFVANTPLMIAVVVAAVSLLLNLLLIVLRLA